jgi:hypothetical protein
MAERKEVNKSLFFCLKVYGFALSSAQGLLDVKWEMLQVGQTH